jgi:serine/threonine protein kinase
LWQNSPGTFCKVLLTDLLGSGLTRRGVDYLHSHKIIHRDIKCSNCLIGSDTSAKIADFGACKHILAPTSRAFQGTPVLAALRGTSLTSQLYMAPEALVAKKFGRQVDVWSVGCCVVEMLSGDAPYQGR